MVKEKIFFMHIAKTAGTSFNNFLSSQFDSEDVFTHIESHPSWINNANTDILKQAAFISGHIRFPIFQSHFNVSEYFKITLFREPYSHIASHLSWVRNLSKNKRFFEGHSQHVQNITHKMLKYDFSKPRELSDYLASMEHHEINLFDNCQLRYFFQPEFGKLVSETGYREAKNNLGKMDFIGLTEFYKTSLIVLSKLKKWPHPSEFEVANKSTNYSGINFLKKEFTDVLKPYVFYDLRMYRHAKNTFRKEYSDYIKSILKKSQ